MCFLLFFLVSIRKSIVEVSHVYKKLIYILNLVKVKVSRIILVKFIILYLSTVAEYFPWFTVFLVQPYISFKLVSLIFAIFCAVDLFGCLVSRLSLHCCLLYIACPNMAFFSDPYFPVYRLIRENAD